MDRHHNCKDMYFNHLMLIISDAINRERRPLQLRPTHLWRRLLRERPARSHLLQLRIRCFFNSDFHWYHLIIKNEVRPSADQVVAEPEVAAEVAPVVTTPSAEVCKSRCDHQN